MGKIHRLTLTVETVTPLFLAGAEPRGAPELRAPSLRGALRYWLRAIMGSVIGNNIGELQGVESTVFGSVGGSGEGFASPLTIRVNADRLPIPQVYSRQPPVRVKKGTGSLRQPTGRDYLFWSMSESGSHERGNYQPGKQFYPPGVSFDITLSVRPGVRNPEQVFQQALSALWLLIHLGGIGSRSRRTGGSLSVTGRFEAHGLKYHLEKETLSGLAGELGQGIRLARQQAVASLKAGSLRLRPPFDILHPGVSKIWVLGVWNNSDVAIEEIGSAMRDFRSYREPDHSNVAKWLTGDDIPTVERAVFGLPVPYRYSGGGPSGTVQARVGAKILDRRASPLWLKVSKVKSNLYVGVATLFESTFLPTGGALAVKGHNTVKPPADYSLIMEWIASSFSQAQEVRYD